MLDINNTYVDAMFDFAARRHRYALGEKVDDEILRRHFFTNIYCECDESTAMMRRATTEGRYPLGLLPALIRVLFNQAYTISVLCQEAGKKALKEFILTGDYTNLLHVLKSNYCTSSAEYLIKQPAGYMKLEGLLLIARNFRELAAWKQTDAILYFANSNENPTDNYYSYKTISYWLSSFRWIGPFLANEVAYEISMQCQQFSRPMRDVNSFALCGTSTLRGIARLMGKYDKAQCKGGKGGRVDPKTIGQDKAQEYLQYLFGIAKQRFTHNCTNPRPSEKYKYDWPEWRLREVTRCLGEFDRYERFRLGQRLYAIGDRDNVIIDNRILHDVPSIV